MKIRRLFFTLAATACFFQPTPSLAQIDEDQLGAWYMYFWNNQFENSPWGLQGDVQHRNWDSIGDLEQLLIRGGVTYTPQASKVMFTFGYANISSGEFGRSSSTSSEERVYQEALLPQRIGGRMYLRHRFRLEQRWVENQDLRSRFRYALFMDVPLNQTDMSQGALYLSFYNELFINGENDIGNNRSVDTFDRNRSYAALGYSLRDNLRLQFGYMHQSTNTLDKGQLQLSLHHSF